MRQYRTIQGDMWDGIAFKVYGSEAYMNTLLEANQEYAHYVIPVSYTHLVKRCTPNSLYSEWRP